jgi:hypothetical protein
MSIYSTLWTLKFPAEGDDYFGCEWVSVTAQGVPAHIGTPTPGHGYEDGDPYASFLPPAIAVSDDDNDASLRAVVIVHEGTAKVGQEYIAPLLVLTGTEYLAATFEALHERICDALRGIRPRVVAQLIRGDGETNLFFEHATADDADSDEE